MAESKVKVYGRPSVHTDIRLSLGACPGCGHPVAAKAIMEAMDELGIGSRTVLVGGIGCHVMGFFLANVDMAVGGHGTAPAIATGIKHALYDDAMVITVQGDGDAAAIGAGYLINAAARAEKITVFMLNNANYGTTGGQMAPTTILGQVTTTTPWGRDAARYGYPMHVPEMLATMRGVVYAARGSVHNPANYTRTKKFAKAALQKQIDSVGFGFVEILTACPVDWHMDPLDALVWMEKRQTVEYPVGEFKNIDHIE